MHSLRSGAVPCFRVVVKAAIATGLLPRNPAPAPDEPARFLIVHLSGHIGDTVMLLPMIEALRSAHPAAHIACTVETPMASFLEQVPAVDRVYAFDLGRPGPTTTPWIELRRTLSILGIYRKTMRGARPTCCIIPRWGCGFRDLMLAYLTQAPARVGYGSRDFDASPVGSTYRDTLLTECVFGGRGMRDPQKYLHLLAQAGLGQAGSSAEFNQPNASLVRIAATMDWPALALRLQLDPLARFAVLAPGATAARRMWPMERWARLAEMLHRERLSVVILAGARDAENALALRAAMPAESQLRTSVIAGATNLAESSCLLSRAALFVGNDSGPGHLAGALGIFCVVLFIADEFSDPAGPSAPERIRPMGGSVVCCRPARTLPPCHGYCTAAAAHCIETITLDEVARAMKPRLDALAAAEVPLQRFVGAGKDPQGIGG